MAFVGSRKLPPSLTLPHKGGGDAVSRNLPPPPTVGEGWGGGAPARALAKLVPQRSGESITPLSDLPHKGGGEADGVPANQRKAGPWISR
jgi:hypothetical protein